MKPHLTQAFALLLAATIAVTSAVVAAPAGEPQAQPGNLLVRDGTAQAEILIAPERPRMVTLAALELRHFVEKLSGSRLPIVTAPTPGRLHLCVGESPETRRLGVTAEVLRDGAYRIESGPGWVVLLGRDHDFSPGKMPWPLTRKDVPRAEAEWNKAIAGRAEFGWGFPFRAGFKDLWRPASFAEQMTARYGADFPDWWKPHGAGFWNSDEGGSLNAVYGLLADFGVRWYMPGPLGEVLPTKQATLAVPAVRRAVRPDFALRDWNWYNFAGFDYEDVIWARRIGMNTPAAALGPLIGPHGLVAVHASPAMQKAHPDYYALIGGKRDTTHREHGTPCFTSPGFEAETVRYIRFLLDTYDLPAVDIWPCDGLQVCQCPTCKGLSASEAVWGFANRVAKQIHTSHPGKRITCGAYTSYVEPPKSTERLSPNLAVWLSNCGRPRMLDPEHWREYQGLIQRWQARLAPGNLIRLENNRYHIWGDGPIAYPVLHPRGTARELKSLRGVSLGDTGEQSQVGGKWRSPGLEHITLYVQARFLWDSQQDVEALLEEYCRLFYGPAAKQMFEAITFAETNLAVRDESRRGKGNPMNVSLAVCLRLRELLTKARTTAGDTVYGRRIDAVLADLEPVDTLTARYRKKEGALAEARAKAIRAVGVEGTDPAKAVRYTLSDNATGKPPAVATAFQVAWVPPGDPVNGRATLVLDIVCQEPAMAQLRATREVHDGDHVVVTLETPLHSYYHLEIGPEGAIRQGNPGPGWESLAEVTCQRGPDSYRVRIRLPVVGAAEAESDPRHRIAGAKPTTESPWYFNVGRIRVVDLKKPERQAFSPTRAGWHVPERFARLLIAPNAEPQNDAQKN